MEKIRALIVDDSEINQLILEKILESAGISSICVDSGKTAINEITAQKFDLILMDIQMPDMDGYQATNLIRSTENGKDIPIIAVTANVSVEEKSRCMRAGMNYYLPKPVHPQDMNQLLDELHLNSPVKDTRKNRVQNVQVENLYEKIHGDLDFLKIMTDRFETSSLDIITSIETAIKEQQFSDIPVYTHKMKGILSAFDENKAIQINQELTLAAKEKNSGDLLTILNQLEEELHSFLSILHEFIEEKSE